MRALAAVLALVLGAPFAVAREQNASLPVRERIITRHFPVKLPPHPCAVPSAIQFIAAAVEAVSGTEFSPEPCDWRNPPPSPVDEINLLGRRVEQALDILVKIDPRYAWQESNGVVILRPVDAWVDNEHFVHEAIGPIEFENKAMASALGRLQPIIGLESNGHLDVHAGNTPHGWQEFSVKLPVMSGLDALNAVVRAHGNLHWQLTYCKPARRRENARMLLYTSDRGGIGSSHPHCMPPRKPGM